MTISNEAVEAAAKGMFSEEQCDRRQKLDVEANWRGRLDDRDREEYRRLSRAALEAAVPHIQADALREVADEWQKRSDTFMKTTEHMAASRDYSADDVLRYAAYSAEANTSAYKLRARAAEMRQG